MFETEVFRKQMYCTEKSTYDIVRTFRRPHSDSAPGELRPSCPPRYAPDGGAHPSVWFSAFAQLPKTQRGYLIPLTTFYTSAFTTGTNEWKRKNAS